jgi:toxin CcdB
VPRFDVYRNPNRETREEFPYLLDVQADLFSELATRLVVPLARRTAVRSPLTRLNPIFPVEGKPVVMLTTEIAGVPVAALGAKVSSLAENAVDIVGAIDFLLTGV